jgi:hypothetical protein
MAIYNGTVANDQDVNVTATNLTFFYDDAVDDGTGSVRLYADEVLIATYVASDFAKVGSPLGNTRQIEGALSDPAFDAPAINRIEMDVGTFIDDSLRTDQEGDTVNWTRGTTMNPPPLPKSRGFWGLRASRMDIPKFIQKNFQDSAILTRRGWEQRLPGSNPDKGMTEVVVAGNFGIPAGNNEAPYFFEGVNPLSRTLEGTSGSPINPYIIEIVDPHKVLEGDSVSVVSNVGIPTGLSVQKMSINSPLEIFAIVGTPSSSGTGSFDIVFEDGSSSQIAATITYDIG